MRLENGDVLLFWPLALHVLTAGYYYSGGGTHIDLRTNQGGSIVKPVYAAEDGAVDWEQEWDGHTRTGMQSYGTALRLRHADYNGQALQTRYAHLSRMCVHKGQQVKEGQLIGYTGATGNVYGAHLHFEVILGGSRRNPLVWLDDDFTTADKDVYTYGPGQRAVQRPEEAPAQAGLTTVSAAGLTNEQAMRVYMLCLGLQLVALQLYTAVYADAEQTRQDVTVGPVTAGDSRAVRALLEEMSVEAVEQTVG